MGAPRSPAERAAVIALLTTVLLAAIKLAVWGLTGSIAVLSQALDSTIDLVALGLVLFGVRIASKPADEEHHYGHGKAENLVAFTQTLILGFVAVAVVVESIRRLTDEAVAPTAPWYAVALFALSIAVDVWRVRMLRGAARSEGSEALRAGALNLSTDIGTAAVALVSLLAVRAGIERADAIGALIVVTAVAVAAVRLGRRSVDVLMDRAPEAPVEAIAQAAAEAPGVAETRRVRVRSAGKQLFADVTVAAGRTASLERAHDISDAVEAAIERVVPGADVVVHVEPISETSGFVERVHASASRVGGVSEVHNVSVHAFDDAGARKLHVTLHAKVAPGTRLETAHDIADAIEETVAGELGAEVRVDAHIEPLEQTGLGQDVTAERPDLIEVVKQAAREESDLIDCHEVIVTASNGSLSIVAHVKARKDLPLERIHDASERIEKHVHAAHPEVGRVLLHFEPAG